MLLRDVVATSERVRKTRKRNEKTELLASCIAGLGADEVEIGVAFLCGEMRQGKIGLGFAAIRDAATQPAAEPTLSLAAVDRRFGDIATARGAGSGRHRQERFVDLLSQATAVEQEFLRHLVIGELRQGALEGVVIEAVARAATVPAAAVRRAVMLSGDLRSVATAALARGEAGLDEFRLELFRPLQPMLAQTAEAMDDVLSDLDGAFEYKLDGARIQIHRVDDDIRIFSRRMNDVSERIPEVVEAVRSLPVRRIVLDGEAIALRPDGTPHAFQDTMRRFGRRKDVDRLRDELPVSPFVFDCLHLDGDDLIDRPGRERWQALERVVPDGLRIERIVPNDREEAQLFVEEALERGHEGVMKKSLRAPYEAGRRGASWLKLKPTHTLDLVVLAVDWGSGRRRGYLSNLHLGARDPSSGAFVMLGKTFKGMTDDMLRWQTEKLSQLEVSSDDWTVVVRPELVVEIAFDGVQTSHQYPGGMALRFARVKRYREDKDAAEADTLDAVRAIHQGKRLDSGS